MNFGQDLVAGGWGSVLTVSISIAAAVGAYFVLRLFVLPLLTRWSAASSFRWDDIIANRRLQHRLALVGPVILVYVVARTVADESSEWTDTLLRGTTALLVFSIALLVSGLLSAANEIYESKAPRAKDRPIEAYVQLAQILVFLFAGVLILAALMDKSPGLFLAGLGALTAVLLLVFKDTLLGLVASVQITTNDLVDVGDKIEMPEFAVDGDVIDVDLHSITVLNYDKTTSTIPTQALLGGAYRNWSAVRESDRRRIKRAIHIDVSTIRFLRPEEIDRLTNLELLHDYMLAKRADLTVEQVAAAAGVGHGMVAHERQLTNVGTFRAYIVRYLEQLDTVDTESMFFVRQLDPGRHGLPLQVAVFVKTAETRRFEEVQADIFDHLLAMVPEFDLRVFQDPTTDQDHVGRFTDGEPTTTESAFDAASSRGRSDKASS
ncbi:MAG: mechanosensitive ion channel family protein [Acidimicrobiia bacterium]